MPNQPSVLTGALKKPFAEQVAYFRNKMGNLIPTQRWSDVKGAEHDIGFMVAGAQKADLLADLASAVDRAITEGKSLQAFRKDFFSIVEKRGWHNYTGSETEKGRAWRTRIIYQTNMATSYAAARCAQLIEADFELWVYKHGDSRNPRQQHLAWDGMALPKDHPFWQTHYPPADNVYGCSCYVVGARNKNAAQRLGADLDKTLPDDWEPPEESTGYPLGERVIDTVRVMAEKTRNWDYAIAKAYMQDVPEAVRDQLAQGYRNLPSVADDARNYAKRIIDKVKGVEIPEAKTLGLVTTKDNERITKLGLAAVAGYDWALDRTSIGHILKKHGSEATEVPRGQRAVTAEDYARLPQILNAYENIELSEELTGQNRPALIITSEIDGEKIITVWEVRSRNQRLALKTMMIRKRR